jgi:site-specific DNA recombinase
VSAGMTSMREDRGGRLAAGMVKQAGPKPLRCAIYTRKSTENGLEQEFNSLDNQREAAEAYIKSQAHEGWRLLPGAYDDGGFSGGSLERPAIQRLLAEVRAGRVDVIVVYKVDRLTRSLSDFAKLVDLFDQHGVSFVSVTQAFNTTTSMGRLTLNVLLSFAQFEREVTGERIRDKIAASKRKGMRVGGPVPLGYQVRDKKLVPCPAEADQVTLIFRSYLELGRPKPISRARPMKAGACCPAPMTMGGSLGAVWSDQPSSGFLPK